MKTVYILILSLVVLFGKAVPIQGSKVADGQMSQSPSVSWYDFGAAFAYAVNIESHGDIKAYNSSEDAKGLVQIRPIMVREVNRIIRVWRIAGVRDYVHDDAYNPILAREMFDLFILYHCPKGTIEQQYHSWNTGIQTMDAETKFMLIEGLNCRIKETNRQCLRNKGVIEYEQQRTDYLITIMYNQNEMMKVLRGLVNQL